jgi:hypothetical protein
MSNKTEDLTPDDVVVDIRITVRDLLGGDPTPEDLDLLRRKWGEVGGAAMEGACETAMQELYEADDYDEEEE